MLAALFVRLGVAQRLSQALGVLIPLGLVALAVSFLWFRGEHFRKSADKWHEATLKWEAANEAATAWAKAEKLAREARSVADAKRLSHEHETLAADTRSAADRFIAANRVRVEAGQCRPVQAAPAASADGPGVPVDLPADAVVVGASDVRSCSAWVAFGLKAREAVFTMAKSGD